MTQDKWAAWLLQRRFGGDEQQMQKVLQELYAIRDGVLQHAALQPGELLLDVGSGDGLIAFGALRQTPGSRVIMSDISHDLLAHASELTRQMGLAGRYHVILSPANGWR